MKRALLFFLVLSTATPVLSSERPRPPRQSPRSTPEVCRVDANYANTVAAGAGRTTQEVAAGLPRRSGPVLHPRPAVELGTGTTNVVDIGIFGALASHGIQPAAEATDEEFCRRVSLDLTGLQPSPERVLAYVQSTEANKKESLVDELMASPAFVDRWTNWFGDLTRSTVTGGSEFLLNRNSEYRYLRTAISENRPVDRIARDYIAFAGKYNGGPSGFLPRATYQVDLQQDRFDEMAIETSRAFLGVQIACISCHDGAGHLEAINLNLAGKKRKDFWRVAAFYAQTDFDFYDHDFDDARSWNVIRNANGRYIAETQNGQGMRPARKGGLMTASFKLFGKGKPKGVEDPRVSLAKLVTGNPQFARAFVNRVFAHFFTVGLVEPLDGFDLARLDPAASLPAGWTVQPSNPKLLADLASEFTQSGFDLRALMRTMVLSRAYALSSRYDESAWNEGYARFYARKLARRLTAEEVYDGIVAASGVPSNFQANGFDESFATTMALPGPTEPYYRPEAGALDNPGNVREFLRGFGRGDRFVTERSARSTIGQALWLLNDGAIGERIVNRNDNLAAALDADLAAGRITAGQAVSAIYLRTLARQPTATELQHLAPLVANRLSIANLQWALLNRVDFLYNY